MDYSISWPQYQFNLISCFRYDQSCGLVQKSDDSDAFCLFMHGGVLDEGPNDCMNILCDFKGLQTGDVFTQILDCNTL